ncbi:unnamed protein product [Candidula unifasciata]|uniref:MD-2-related lipid-recognition domain-containing protein n=1 Tax=Candidula unifasciata TaxID=100452 RepID=A0A8S3Z394_9EUPU|nr:unnamed protein product [Candidula unifasciata]
MKVLLISAVIYCAIATCFAQKVEFHDCGSQLSTINEVDVNPCPSLPCIFKTNSNVTLTITLTPNAAVSDAKSVVTGIIEGIPVPFPLPDENACNFMTCPLAPGTAVTYKTAIFVRPEYPSTNLIVQWEVTSSSGEVFCFLVPATISK